MDKATYLDANVKRIPKNKIYLYLEIASQIYAQLGQFVPSSSA